MDSDRFINAVCLITGVLMVSFFIYTQSQPDNDDLIKDGRYWATACSLKEVDIPTGMFTSNINRLDCSGVVVNVVTDRYDMAISAYNKSKNQE
ncbi:hypothetical protein ACQFN5_00325 (plasmid) [Klebsiella sp. WOUb02]|uniref:hypothetical protein n=1 Tax=Klebsiella sp. WOUb02 TaxID=3161071 RepID=UPI003CE681C8